MVTFGGDILAQCSFARVQDISDLRLHESTFKRANMYAPHKY